MFTILEAMQKVAATRGVFTQENLLDIDNSELWGI